MRVLVLGAGASIGAGYPNAEKLLDTLKRDAEQSRNIQLKDAWAHWERVVSKAPEEVRPLLTARNPEIVLSFLDLCEMFISENFSDVFPGDTGREAADQSLGSDHLDRRLFRNAGHAWLHDASTAKERLILLLGEYFMWRHVEDSQQPERRTYLRDLLGDLKTGDVIVTLNWDTTAERTLLELERWSPMDGYGFSKRFRAAEDFGGQRPVLSGSLSKQSEIQVLKLHGSVGWHSGGCDDLLFDDVYLQYLLPESLSTPIVDFDSRPFQDSLPHALAYPSFLKRFENRFILDIWRRADEALRRADAVEIWGYSLPPSDSAVGVLLQSLRSRTLVEAIRPVVNNPNGEHLDRFRQFFDRHVLLSKRGLG